MHRCVSTLVPYLPVRAESRQPHSSALSHGIDALTIQVSVPAAAAVDSRRSRIADEINPHYADLARCVEHLLRSMSNLHERLHHSIAQYTMPSPSKFVSHGEYIYPALLVSLPMVARAASLALRDVTRFQFGYVAAISGAVGVSTLGICLSAATFANERMADFGWGAPAAAYFISYLLLALIVQRHNNSLFRAEAGENAAPENDDPIEQDAEGECRRKSLRFIACMVGIYLHAPLLLANYSLGFPSSLFWSPLLGTLAMPLTLRRMVSSYKLLGFWANLTKCILMAATCPPFFLVPRMFATYTPYVLWVYTPLHLLLAALWLT